MHSPIPACSSGLRATSAGLSRPLLEFLVSSLKRGLKPQCLTERCFPIPALLSPARLESRLRFSIYGASVWSWRNHRGPRISLLHLPCEAARHPGALISRPGPTLRFQPCVEVNLQLGFQSPSELAISSGHVSIARLSRLRPAWPSDLLSRCKLAPNSFGPELRAGRGRGLPSNQRRLINGPAQSITNQGHLQWK